VFVSISLTLLKAFAFNTIPFLHNIR